MRSALIIVAGLAACADPAPLNPARDTGVLDAEPRDRGSREDARADGAVSTDAGFLPDAGDLSDGAVTIPDIGPAPPGGACETAGLWDPLQLKVSTTSAAFHRDRLTCGGRGAGADSPEHWWRADLAEPRHVVLRLGTAGWDGILGVRTATCASDLEACADQPPVLEVPVVDKTFFVAVEGFGGGRGPYVLSADLGPPLTVPSPQAVCSQQLPQTLPFEAVGHNFGVPGEAVADCPMVAAVHHVLDVATATSVVVRVTPNAAQDLVVALRPACDAPALLCVNGRGVETLGPRVLTAGRWIVSVGSTPNSTLGSYVIRSEIGACGSDPDCGPRAECRSLQCQPSSFTPIPIPDLGQLTIRTQIAFSGRPSRIRARLALSHSAPEDLLVTLQSPDPEPIVVRLRHRRGGPLDEVFGDVPADGPGDLADFGLVPDARGEWLLRISDQAAGDSGTVQNFRLEVE